MTFLVQVIGSDPSHHNMQDYPLEPGHFASSVYSIIVYIVFIVCADADEEVNLGWHWETSKKKLLPSGLCFEIERIM